MGLCLSCMTEVGEEQFCPICGFNQHEACTVSPAFLQPGTMLNNRYIVGIALGQGGFGITYIGYDTVLNTKVAIKEYYPSDIASRNSGDGTVSAYSSVGEEYVKGRERFLDEARTLAKFADHPCIVGVRDCFDTNGTAYMIMEFLEGVNLKEYLKRKGGVLPVNEAISIITPVMDALRAVHKMGIIHRDISPDNIYITTDARVRLIDFGAARQSIGGQKSLSIMLKPGYAPEEQYRSKGNQGPWTDVYALTATLYRMITGKVPPDSLERVMDDTLDVPNTLPPHIIVALKKGLAVRAPERFSSVEQLQMALAGENVSVGTATPVNTNLNAYSENHTVNNRNDFNKNSGNNKWLIVMISILSGLIVVLMCILVIAFIPNDSNMIDDGETNIVQGGDIVQPQPVIKVHSYDVIVATVQWETAYRDALSKGGYLVAINDAAEFSKIKNIISNYSSVRNVWIGARAPEGYNSYEMASAYWNSSSATWVNGEPFTFAEWRMGEPSGYDANLGISERYLQIFNPEADHYKWSFNDAGTDISEYKAGTLAYIIEYDSDFGAYQ